MTKFCVLGASGPVIPMQRQWHDDVEGAVDHAKELARQSYAQHAKPVSLYVVEIKQVVEVGIPDVIVRDLDVKDMPGEALGAARAYVSNASDDEDEAQAKRPGKPLRR